VSRGVRFARFLLLVVLFIVGLAVIATLLGYHW
jgi:hypothetical protein